MQVGYKKVGKDFNLEAGMVFAPSQSSSKDLISSERDIPARRVWNIAPYARLRWRFSKTRSLSANYRARTSEASLSALQPVADVSNPLHITVGNPELKPTFTQSVAMHFNDFNAERQQSVFAVLNASYALNSVANRTTTDPTTGVRTTTYANVNGNFSIFGMGMISRPISARHWRMNAHLSARYSNNAGYINGDFNRSGNLMLNPRFGITYSNDVFQMTVNPAYTLGLATNSLPRQPKRTTHTYGFTADATLTLPFGLNVSTDLDFSASSGYLDGFNSTQWLWNAEISYSMLRDRSLTVFARANDILHQSKNISRTVNANLISDSETNNLTRYFTCSASRGNSARLAREEARKSIRRKCHTATSPALLPASPRRTTSASRQSRPSAFPPLTKSRQNPKRRPATVSFLGFCLFRHVSSCVFPWLGSFRESEVQHEPAEYACHKRAYQDAELRFVKH